MKKENNWLPKHFCAYRWQAGVNHLREIFLGVLHQDMVHGWVGKVGFRADCWQAGIKMKKRKKIGFRNTVRRNSSAPIVDKRGSSAPGAASRLAAAKPYRQILGAGIFLWKKGLRCLKVAKAWENFSRKWSWDPSEIWNACSDFRCIMLRLIILASRSLPIFTKIKGAYDCPTINTQRCH